MNKINIFIKKKKIQFIYLFIQQHRCPWKDLEKEEKMVLECCQYVKSYGSHDMSKISERGKNDSLFLMLEQYHDCDQF